MKRFLLVLLPFFITSATVAQSNTKVKSMAGTSLAYLKALKQDSFHFTNR